MRASAAARGHLDDHDGELRSEGTAVDPSVPVGEAAFAVMRRNFEAFVARERGTRLGEDPEELHDMRVASRRMRGAMVFFREALPVRALRLRDELEWVAGALGAVRDLDVQLEQLESWSNWDAGVNRTSLAALRDLFDVERADARGELLKALDSPRYARLLDGTRRLLDGSPLRRPLASRAPIAVAGASLLGRRYRAMRRAGDRIGEESAAEDYHRLRIRCKRLRYALEFLADVYPDGTGPLIRRLVALQTLLGMQQDADVAVRRLAALATREGGRLPPPTVFAMGMVAERYADQGRDLRARFPKVYGKVRGRPWKELQLVMKEAASAHASAPASTKER